RNRLEWTWGLGHGHLDEHLQEFVDPQGLLADQTVLVFPHNGIIEQIFKRANRGKSGVRRPHIQKAATPLNIWFFPSTPLALLLTRLLNLEVPPHLALCATSGKMSQAWGSLPREVCDAQRASLLERAKAAIHSDRPALGMWQLTNMQSIHRNDWDALSSVLAKNAKRRLLPSELQPVPKTAEIQLFPSVDGDGDDAISVDSHISGVEGDPEKFATHGDYEVDRKWLKKMRRWAEGTSGADAGEALFNDGQINEDSREQPRDATSLDLAKPDYLERRGET
ncbi:hypothetical protein B0H14DRAFT_2779900, partial [Mycena olivaceomarginata]